MQSTHLSTLDTTPGGIWSEQVHTRRGPALVRGPKGLVGGPWDGNRGGLGLGFGVPR